jgi:hypothetical protein
MACVIVLHTVPIPILMQTGAVFTIWQAVAVFMILMGFNGLRSFLGRQGDHYMTVVQTYASARLAAKFRRLLVPFCFLWVFSLAVGLLRGDVYLGPLLLVGLLPYRWGPGNYFITIVFQFTLLAPVIFWAYSRRPGLTMAAMVLCDVGFQLAAPSMSWLRSEPYLYTACILRYSAAIALGMWIVGDEAIFSRRNWFVLPYAAVGFAYLELRRTTGFTLPFLPAWGNQTVASFGWPLLLVLLALKVLPTLALPSAVSQSLCRVGRASYAIFLLQIGFFAAGFFVVDAGAFAFSFAPSLGLPHRVDKGVSLLLVLVANLCVCLLLGVMWQERFLGRPRAPSTSR